jgi:hypothetical protein
VPVDVSCPPSVRGNAWGNSVFEGPGEVDGSQAGADPLQ